ncbi:hypothetical protein ETAE_2129 [Edwardsiella piscicida]|uniref:Uncharacterized protein n=1 Tax=Edwardsiella piscicida TaxID=1263550 RepID=A0AAU8P430_EDWPI|nr:hypothetical protein ETAE_2129 [Edwardsiella tarda EIB202]
MARVAARKNPPIGGFFYVRKRGLAHHPCGGRVGKQGRD